MGMAADYMCGDGYEVATVGNICEDGRIPSRIVEQDVNGWGWL